MSEHDRCGASRAITRRMAGKASAGLALGALLAVFAVSDPARAQKYPDRPVRIIVPFAAGGVADITVRVVAER